MLICPECKERPRFGNNVPAVEGDMCPRCGHLLKEERNVQSVGAQKA